MEVKISNNALVFTIFDVPKLDPITVVLEDIKQGHGRLIVECYSDAWAAYWSAMGGDTTVREFVVSVGTDYLVNRLWPCGKRRTKSDEQYLGRIVEAIQMALMLKECR